MSHKMKIDLVSFGANTPVGHTARITAASLHTGISRIAEHPFLHDDDGQPILVARSRVIPAWVEGHDRFSDLVKPALLECLDAVERRVPLKIAVLLAMPIPRVGLQQDHFLAELANILPNSGHEYLLETFPQGHAAGLFALERAAECLAGNEVDLCLLVGVDSYYAPKTLKWLEAEERLHCTSHSWGFIPGEGAACVLLTSPETTQKLGLESAGTVSTLVTHQPEQKETQDALSQVFSEICADLSPERPIQAIFCDLNGERGRADEYSKAALKAGSLLNDPSAYTTVVGSCGDVGAATVPLLLLLASQHKTLDQALVWAASDGGAKAACLVG